MGIENSGYMLLFFFLLIPIIIHFLSFVKTKKVFFSRTLFLQEVVQSKNKVNKLKYLAVLASRVLALLFLILAIINFFLPDTLTNSKGKFGAYHIDNSLSIDNQHQGVLESIKKFVLKDLANYESSSLNVNNFDKKGLYFLPDDSFRERLEQVELTTESFDLSKVIARYNHINKISSLDTDESEMVLISDFQKPISKVEGTDFANWKIIKLNSDVDKFNVTIDSVWLESPFVELGETNQLSVNYTSSGAFESSINCKLFIDDIQVASSIIDKTTGLINFDFTIDEPGNHFCKLEIGDDIVFDNTHFFTMATGSKISIAVITEEEGGLLKKVYNNEPTFEVSSYSKANLSVDELSKFDVVVFDQIEGNDLLAGLVKNRWNKGTMVYIPPADLKDNDLIFQELKNHVSGMELIEDTTLYRLSSSVNKAFFDGVFSDNKSKFDFTTSKKIIQLTQHQHSSIISFLDKSSLLVKKNKLFVFAVPLLNDFTKIHTHALFVPLMYKIAMSSTQVNTQLSYYVDDVVTIAGDFNVSDKISLRTNDANILIDFTLGANSDIVFDAGKFNIQPGIYDLVKNDSIFTKVAFNLSKKESIMEFYSEEEISNMFPGATVENLLINEVENSLSRSEKTSDSIWKYCLTLSLLMLFIEIILINYLK